MDKPLTLYLDSCIRRQLCVRQTLSLLGLELRTVSTVSEAKDMLTRCHPCIILMHTDVAGKDVFSLCSFLRACCAHAILIVLMNRARASTEERLFDCGASDVVAGEQTVARVLMKRIRSHIQRSEPLWCTSRWVALGDAVVDFDRREVWRDETVRRLPGILSDLLKYFVDNADRVISREELMASDIWSDSICTPPDEGGKTFDVHVGKLRKIIESDPHTHRIITSVRGIGWKLATKAVKGT